jgi:hypothetical protein
MAVRGLSKPSKQISLYFDDPIHVRLDAKRINRKEGE